jgi:hypothetical protein
MSEINQVNQEDLPGAAGQSTSPVAQVLFDSVVQELDQSVGAPESDMGRLETALDKFVAKSDLSGIVADIHKRIDGFSNGFRGLNELELKLDNVKAEFKGTAAATDAKIDGLIKTTDAKINGLTDKIDILMKANDAKIDGLTDKIDVLMKANDTKIDVLMKANDTKIDGLAGSIQGLKTSYNFIMAGITIIVTLLVGGGIIQYIFSD